MAFTRLLALGLGIAGVAPLWAADFAVMETASTIAPRHFKFLAFPILLRAREFQEQETGVNVGLGFGLSERWDIELQIANYDDITYYGTDLEFGFIDGARLDGSLGVGVHHGISDFGDVLGYDATAILSYAWGNTGLTWNAALDWTYNDLDLNRAPSAGIMERYNTLHIVPGAQYRISQNVDLIAEVGIGVDDDGRDYASTGISYYFR